MLLFPPPRTLSSAHTQCGQWPSLSEEIAVVRTCEAFKSLEGHVLIGIGEFRSDFSAGGMNRTRDTLRVPVIRFFLLIHLEFLRKSSHSPSKVTPPNQPQSPTPKALSLSLAVMEKSHERENDILENPDGDFSGMRSCSTCTSVNEYQDRWCWSVERGMVVFQWDFPPSESFNFSAIVPKEDRKHFHSQMKCESEIAEILFQNLFGGINLRSQKKIGYFLLHLPHCPL